MRLKTKTLNFAGQVFHVGIDVHSWGRLHLLH